MASFQAAAALLAGVWAVPISLAFAFTSSSHSSIASNYYYCAMRSQAGFGIVSGPLLATSDKFQRSLLEAQFANNRAIDSNSSSSMTIANEHNIVPPTSAGEAQPQITNNTNNAAITVNSILRIAALTDRGQNANAIQKDRMSNLIASLESNWPKHDHDSQRERTISIIPNHLVGTWELLYSNTQLFRSSPFFLAGRRTCTTPEQAAQYDWFCNMHRAALAISTIGNVRQVISKDGRMVNEFEVRAGAIPFLSDLMPSWKYSGGLPLTINGAIVSTADIKPKSTTTSASTAREIEWELYMDTVEIKGSNVPVLRNFLDSENISLKSRDLSRLLENNIDSYETPKPVIRTTYVDEDMRIVRDEDDNIFVYAKISSSEQPTDYSGVLADFGVASLLEGFNDAVTKIYL